VAKKKKAEKSAHQTKQWWWALSKNRRTLPVIFSTRGAAEVNADPDERLFRVQVVLVSEHEKRPADYEGSPF
jgi:hypothetical protein